MCVFRIHFWLLIVISKKRFVRRGHLGREYQLYGDGGQVGGLWNTNAREPLLQPLDVHHQAQLSPPQSARNCGHLIWPLSWLEGITLWDPPLGLGSK